MHIVSASNLVLLYSPLARAMRFSSTEMNAEKLLEMNMFIIILPEEAERGVYWVRVRPPVKKI